MRSKTSKKSKNTPSTAKSTHGKSIGDLPQALCRSVLLTLGIGASLVFVASLFLSFTPDPLRWAAPIGVTVSAVSAFLGGFLAVRIHGQNALLCGLCNGSICLVLLLLISLGFSGHASHHTPLLSLLLHLGFPLLSVLGAYAGRPSAKGRKRRRKHT